MILVKPNISTIFVKVLQYMLHAKRNYTILDFTFLPIFKIIQYKLLIRKCVLDYCLHFTDFYLIGTSGKHVLGTSGNHVLISYIRSSAIGQVFPQP